MKKGLNYFGVISRVFFISFLSMCLFHWGIPNASAEKIQESTETKSVDLRNTKHFEAGVTLGNPAVFNLLMGYWMGRIGFRVSGLSWRYSIESEPVKVKGIRCGINWKLKEEPKILHSLGLAASFSKTETEEDWRSVVHYGISYNVNWRGFFVSLLLGLADWASPVRHWVWPGLALEVGYVHRFFHKVN